MISLGAKVHVLYQALIMMDMCMVLKWEEQQGFTQKNQENTQKNLISFLEFLDSLEVSEDDLNHLLANLSSYCAQKKQGRLYL
ncbi:hypothetical protein [Shewanella frigidimarina]|uniref:hypothetical protein n=1 Tax=Shewanella frigidimarina TaxID=56812 RepID=UPI003D7A1A83